MTGPEHYREAERLLNANIIRSGVEEGQHDYAADRPSKSDHHREGQGNLAAAQVHATLALAAATAAAQAAAYDGDEDHSRSRGWAGVA